MKKMGMRKFGAALAALMICAGLASVRPASAAVADWQKGATIYPRWNTDFSSDSFKQSVQNLKAANANTAVLHIPLHQSNVYSTDIYIGGDAPTDQSLTDGINYVHSLGMRAVLKFQVIPNDGQWSAYIDPGDRTTWFNNYANILVHFAGIAKATGAEEMILGTELIKMTSDNLNPTNTSNWFSLIGKVRSAYSGQLSYSANWGGDDFTNEKAHIKFWSALDQIGIAAYYNLYGDNSVGNLTNQWNNWNYSDIKPLADQWGKPVIFSEIGYKALWDANQHPWMWWEGGGQDQQAQANDYEALFSYWNNYPYVQGVYLWDWSSDPNAGGGGNIDYTPQHKLAENTMKTWFGQGGGPPPPPPPASSTCPAAATNAFTGCYFSDINLTTLALSRTDAAVNFDWGGGSPDPKIPADNFSVRWQGNFTFNAGTYNFTATADDGMRISIDGNQVLDKWFDQPSTTYTFSSSMTAGTHLVKIEYYEHTGNAAAKVSWTSAAPPPPPPMSSIIDIWWPTDGAAISGVQPFKAVLHGDPPLSSYSMFWQVDNGGLVPMGDDTNPWPHKEALVDVSGWYWGANNGAGPYNINFVAKDTSGNVLAQHPIKINVAH